MHPFQDGNGRLSRVLTTLFLLKNGYGYVPYCSLESILEKNKADYYRALKATQTSLKTKPNYQPWLDFFFSSLKKQQELLMKMKDQYVLPLTKVQRDIIEYAKIEPSFQNSMIVENLGMNRNTVKANLARLVELNILRKSGVGKGTWYSLENKI
ncbi:hypothetical protein DID78_06420 [Candidatus Marinamargulisbacteria bacterium SCGC AG-343-D04]|nr:hypothetical protein DID78_06420 [Candidatus Marinamargulisbacteria bacterium SCGC AG-343-D04]